MDMGSVNFWLSVIGKLIDKETDENEKSALRELQNELIQRLKELEEKGEQQ